MENEKLQLSQQVIKTLILLSESISHSNDDVTIVFHDYKTIKQLKTELFKIGIRNPEIQQQSETNKFYIILTSDEYNAVIGKNAQRKTDPEPSAASSVRPATPPGM